MGTSHDTTVPARGDLPGYVLRVSARAKRVRLTVTPAEGLVVVVPPQLADFDPGPVLRDRAAWIAEATAHFSARRTALQADPADLLPHRVFFAMSGEAWRVECTETGSARVAARERDGTIELRGGGDGAARLLALQRWLHRAARERLLPMLADEAARAGLAPGSASVRAQRARWGGCSASGAVTLNRALVFLPRALAVSVVRHELAHLSVPDHSPAFWERFEELEPDARRNHELIARSWDAVPAWAEWRPREGG